MLARKLFLGALCLVVTALLSPLLRAAEATASPAARVAALVEQLGAEEPAARASAAAALEALTVAASRPETASERGAIAKSLAGALGQEHPAAVARIVIENLARVGKWEAVSPLGKVLADEAADPLVRDAARRALEAHDYVHDVFEPATDAVA